MITVIYIHHCALCLETFTESHELMHGYPSKKPASPKGWAYIETLEPGAVNGAVCPRHTISVQPR